MSRSVPQATETVKEFTETYNANLKAIRGYILSLVPNFADAEDVFQEVSRVLWKKYPEYERGTNFLAWACRISEIEVRCYWRKQKQKHANVIFSDHLIECLDCDLRSKSSEVDERLEVIQKCMQELSPTAREAISLRYTESDTAEVLSQKINKTTEATYKILSRSLRALVECVQRRRAPEAFKQ